MSPWPFVKNLTFQSNDLGKEVMIMLAWSPNVEGLCEDVFPIVWKVSKIGKLGPFFLAINFGCGVLMAIALKYIVTEELILSGTYMCDYWYEGDAQLLTSMVWVLYNVWEVLALCLSVLIAVKHFHDLQQLGLSTGSIIGDCFRVLMKSHMLYFASFVCVSCIQFVTLSSEFENSYSMGPQILSGVREIQPAKHAQQPLSPVKLSRAVHITTRATKRKSSK